MYARAATSVLKLIRALVLQFAATLMPEIWAAEPEPPGVFSKVGLLVRIRLRAFPDESAPSSLSKVYLTKKVPVGPSAPGKFPLPKASAPCCQRHQSTCASGGPTP